MTRQRSPLWRLADEQAGEGGVNSSTLRFSRFNYLPKDTTQTLSSWRLGIALSPNRPALARSLLSV